jgi:hypothetical protein
MRLDRALLLAAALCAAPGAQAQQAAAEEDLKAAIVFNFALFTQWPSEAFGRPDEPLVLCFAGEAVARAFGSFAGKRMHGRPVSVRPAGAAPDGCHLVYWHGGKAPPPPRRAGLLTVSDTPGFAAAGGVIEMSLQQANVAFEVNRDAARAARLVISSKLLRLAKRVHGAADE